MVVNFRGKDLNAAGVRVSGTKITATPDEINQALDGISADVTAANLSALTGGEETDLHSHAGGGASGPVWSDPVTVTDTQMLALDTAHIDLVPAPTDQNELLLPLLVFIKQYGTDSGYNDQPNTTHLTIGWGGVSANESGAGTVVAQPIATVLAAAERHTIIPIGTGFAGITGQVGEVAAAITPGPGLAISLGADDAMAGTADATRSLRVWTLYQRVTLPA